jgi:hypothetical protein
MNKINRIMANSIEIDSDDEYEINNLKSNKNKKKQPIKNNKQNDVNSTKKIIIEINCNEKEMFYKCENSKSQNDVKQITIKDSDDEESESINESENESENEFIDEYKTNEKKCDDVFFEIKKNYVIQSIKIIYNSNLQKNQINLEPSYQRDFVWSFEKIKTFIDSLMKGYIIPLFILYKIPNKEKTNKYKFECLDGHHRLYILQKYMNAEPIILGTEVQYIYYEKKRNSHKIFYKLTEDIKKMYKKSREMTKEEKDLFDETQLSFVYIETPLSDELKCEIFNRLQNGEKTSTLIKLKNCSNVITNFLRNNNIINKQIIEEWEIVMPVLINKIIKTHNLIEQYTYLLIRLILIYDKKSLDIDFLNLNLSKKIKTNSTSIQLKTDIREIYKDINIIKNKIIEKFNENKLIAELFMIMFLIILINDNKFNSINKKSMDEILINFNNIKSYKLTDKVVSKENMNLIYNKILLIIDKYK